MKIQRNAKNRNPTNSKSCGAKERNLNASAQLNKEAVVSLKEEMGWPTGFEPATTRITIWDSTIELWPPSEN